MERIYVIQVEVPLGIRNGTILMRSKNYIVMGEMELLGTVEHFKGTLLDDGKIEIEGSLNSQVRSISYLASGYAKEESIQMQIKTDSDL